MSAMVRRVQTRLRDWRVEDLARVNQLEVDTDKIGSGRCRRRSESDVLIPSATRVPSLHCDVCFEGAVGKQVEAHIIQLCSSKERDKKTTILSRRHVGAHKSESIGPC